MNCDRPTPIEKTLKKEKKRNSTPIETNRENISTFILIGSDYMSIYGIHGRVPHIPLKKSMCWNTRVIWTQYLNAYGKEDMGNTLTLGR